MCYVPQDNSTRILFSTEQFDTIFRSVAMVDTLSDLKTADPLLKFLATDTIMLNV